MSIQSLRLISKGLNASGIPVVIPDENTNINEYEKLDLIAVHNYSLVRDTDFTETITKKIFINDAKGFCYNDERSTISQWESYDGIDGDDIYKEFIVFIKSSHNCFITILARSGMSVLDLKREIETIKSYPVSDQRLIYNGKDLNDNQLLGSYKIQEYSIIQIVCRVRGGKPLYILDPKDLAPNYDYVYPSSETTKYTRGGRSFTRPCGWVKYGIKVLGKYKNDTWLGTGDDAWPVSYHGTSKENAIAIADGGYDNKKSVRQAYGPGIYSSQYPYYAEGYASVFEDDGKKYKFMFMNRLDMSCTRNPIDTHFVTEKDDHIRPYAYLIKQI